MKIIDNKKDYYDYLASIYGIVKQREANKPHGLIDSTHFSSL